MPGGRLAVVEEAALEGAGQGSTGYLQGGGPCSKARQKDASLLQTLGIPGFGAAQVTARTGQGSGVVLQQEGICTAHS